MRRHGVIRVYTGVFFLFTNRFHVGVRLFSYISQMTSKCGKNKKMANDAITECDTDAAGYLTPAH